MSKNKHLTSISDLNPNVIQSILLKTKEYSEKENVPNKLSDKLVSNIFFEQSAHTKYSFEIAAKRLKASFIDYQAHSSESAKGMNLIETIKTFEYLGIDICCIRHPDSHFIESLKEEVSFKIVNAGSGLNEHPTQSLLDLYTINKHLNSFENAKIAIYGDIRSSRAALSSLTLFQQLNMKVSLCPDNENSLKNISLGKNTEIGKKENTLKNYNFHIFVNNKLSAEDSFDQLNNISEEDLNKISKNSFFTFTGPLNFKSRLGQKIGTHKQSVVYEQLKDSVFLKMAVFDWLIS